MKKRGNSNGWVSPNPKAYGTRTEPTALERERTVESQIDHAENIINWGWGNNLPLLILDAINQSPTTLSCLGITESFIKGGGFTDEALMELVIDKDGTTLWDLHCQIVPYLTNLEGFATNFKFDQAGRIMNTYVMGYESCRFVKPAEGAKKIEYIKFNPYFGTKEYKPDYTMEFPVWDYEGVKKQARDKRYTEKNPYPGQIYFCGSVRAPFKFYPVPKYWSGEKWIYVDSQIQQFHKSNLDNGFFQSVLLNVIGNPNDYSRNPKYKREHLKEDGVTKVMENRDTTNAMEFDEMMSATFSGVKKAGSVFTLWSSNADNATKVQAFPVTSNFDVLSGTFTDAIRGITIATEVPAILANLPQAVNSLGSDGNSMLRAVEIMQSRTEARRVTLEQFYNNILLPNLVKPVKAKVKIKQYAPVSLPVATMDKDQWAWLNDQEKAAWMEEHMPGIKLFREATAPAQIGEDGQPAPAPQKANEAMKSLNLQQITRATKITQRFATGELTFDQAKQILLGYGFTEADIPAWLPQLNGVEV